MFPDETQGADQLSEDDLHRDLTTPLAADYLMLCADYDLKLDGSVCLVVSGC